NKVFLKPLSTEGQGLPQYPDRKPYKLTQFAIPFGAGVKFRVSRNTVLAYEVGLRKIFTDYLDDVSTTYVDQATLLQERGRNAGRTHGHGLPQYPDRKPYTLTQFAIPFGAGVKFRVSPNTVLAYEVGLRKIFTDYLDDVSTTYVDQATLLQERGPKAVEMAYR